MQRRWAGGSVGGLQNDYYGTRDRPTVNLVDINKSNTSVAD